MPSSPAPLPTGLVRLFVRNIAFQSSEASIVGAVESRGVKVESSEFRFRPDGRNRGMGFVTVNCGDLSDEDLLRKLSLILLDEREMSFEIAHRQVRPVATTGTPKQENVPTRLPPPVPVVSEGATFRDSLVGSVMPLVPGLAPNADQPKTGRRKRKSKPSGQPQDNATRECVGLSSPQLIPLAAMREYARLRGIVAELQRSLDHSFELLLGPDLFRQLQPSPAGSSPILH